MNEDRLHTLEAKREELRSVTDKLGKHIEPGILDTVAALNVLGFTTSGSCEGHLDWSRGVPWVDVSPPLANTINWQTDKEGRHQVVLQLRRAKSALIAILSSYYSTHKTSYEGMIVAWMGGNFIEILPNIDEAFFLLSEEERKEQLPQHQKEMQMFTEYLIKIYLDGADIFTWE